MCPPPLPCCGDGAEQGPGTGGRHPVHAAGRVLACWVRISDQFLGKDSLHLFTSLSQWLQVSLGAGFAGCWLRWVLVTNDFLTAFPDSIP